jgi:DNA topoisomerase VI subunit B
MGEGRAMKIEVKNVVMEACRETRRRKGERERVRERETERQRDSRLREYIHHVAQFVQGCMRAVHLRAVSPLTKVCIRLFSRVTTLFLMSSGSESNPGVWTVRERERD